MKSLKSLFILAPLLAVLGCHQSVTPQQPRAERYRPQQVNIQGDVRDEIVFSPVMTDYKNGSLHVEVPVRSATDLDIIVDYRFTYFDDGRHQVDAPMSWQTKMLHSNLFEIISGDAPSPQARDFQLDIRLAQ